MSGGLIAHRSPEEDGRKKVQESAKVVYAAQFQVVFDAIRQLITPPEPPPKKIGFGVRESPAKYSVKKKRGGRKLRPPA